MIELYESLIRDFAKLHGLPSETLLLTGELNLGEVAVSLIYEGDETSGEITLVGEIGWPKSGNELEMYKAMLQGNLLWAGTSGATLALDEQKGAVACARVALEELNAERLTDLITEFADTVGFWRGYLARA